MKKFTLLFACMATIGVIDSSAKPEATRARFMTRATDAGAKWSAKTQKAYGWNGSEWEMEELYNNTYTADGHIAVQTVTDIDGSVTRQTNRWNENGMLATRRTEFAQSASMPFQETQRLSRTYDDRLTSFITFNDQLVFQNKEWVPSNNYTQSITRDANGNITLMERAVYFQGIYDPIHRIHVSYDEKGIASSITTEDLGYNYATNEYYWKPGDSYTDIVWEATDGQIVSTENLFDGANRIKSATAIISGQENKITASYKEDGRWTANISAIEDDTQIEIQTTTEFIPLDENGSCQITVTTSFISGETTLGFEKYIDEYRYDENGLILLEESIASDGETTEIIGRLSGTVEYDPEFGYPLSWTISEFDPDTEQMVNSFRAEYSDYINLSESSIDNIDADQQRATYFDLTGRRIDNPVKGSILIRKEGNKTEKIKF